MGFHPINLHVEEQEFLVNPTDDCDWEPEYQYSMMLVQKFKQLYDQLQTT